MTNKEFGKLTIDQFRDLIQKLPEIRRGYDVELPKLFKDKQARLKELLGPIDHTWAEIYEFPFHEQIAILFHMAGIEWVIADAIKADDPQQRLMDVAAENGALDEWYAANQESLEFKHLLWLCIALQRNILAIMLFHCSMGHLVDRVRQGDDDAFFHAIEVDRTALGCRPLADRLAQAELLGDKHFFIRLRKALKGPSKKHMAAIQDLRYSIVALRSVGFDSFSDDDLERLFVQTKLYPNVAGAHKNLRKHIQLARKLQPLEMHISGGRQKES
jgi:hypothetical protein